MNPLHDKAIDLLRKLISTPSLSREENQTADILEVALKGEGLAAHRKGNNVWAFGGGDRGPLLLLNSHHDTVKPRASWTRDPFSPDIEESRLYGLGSNDAGASLVALWAVFVHFAKQEELPFRLVYAATAEEEISGAGGIASILGELGEVDLAIIGEPTQMEIAIAEKGLMVLDCRVRGKAGHAAREEGENAIYKALEDILWFQTHNFEKKSELLGPVKMSVTQIEAGSQHNVVPDMCHFVVDVRSNECYSNQELAEIIAKNVKAEVKPRSYRLNSSGIPVGDPLVKAASHLGRKLFGSPTLSDQALIPFPSIKMGPGDSARSHTADEWVGVKEIQDAIPLYISLLQAWARLV